MPKTLCFSRLSTTDVGGTADESIFRRDVDLHSRSGYTVIWALRGIEMDSIFEGFSCIEERTAKVLTDGSHSTLDHMVKHQPL